MFYNDLMLLIAILCQIKIIYAPQEGEHKLKRGRFDLFFYFHYFVNPTGIEKNLKWSCMFWSCCYFLD